jgi:hypothetical protein
MTDWVTQPGSSTVFNQHGSLRDYVVTNYGALGDGLTDDGNAIQATITAATNNGRGTVYFPLGTYAYATSPNFAAAGVHVYCEPGTVLLHTGTGNACIIDGGTGIGLYGLTYKNLTIQGNANSTNGLYVRSIHHSIVDHPCVTGCSVTGKAMLFEGCLAAHVNVPRVSSNEGALSPLPLYGMYFDRKTGGLGNVNSGAMVITSPAMEGLTATGGAGLYFDHANDVNVNGGTSEGNYEGLHYTSNATRNHVLGTDLESNSHYDLYCEGPYNAFMALNASGTVRLTSGNGSWNLIQGGLINQLTLDTNATRNRVVGIVTGSSGGTLTDSGTNTFKLNNYDGVNGVLYADSFNVQATLLPPANISSNNPVSPPVSQANIFLLTWDATFIGVPVTINAPVSPVANGQTITITVKNTIGGALGTFTWNAIYKMGSAWTNPANGFSRSITFYYDGTNWIEISRSPVDVSN